MEIKTPTIPVQRTLRRVESARERKREPARQPPRPATEPAADNPHHVDAFA
jgi:hypothetical protein